MLQEIFDWWQYNFWLGLAGVGVGVVVISPLLLSKRLRKWLSHSNLEPEGLGLLLIALTVLAIGLYNRFLAGGA